jgi:NMD protein affecting ribosome stability and mRNA decay
MFVFVQLCVTTIRKQTHIEVMDTQLYENKHISNSWTHNYTKTNIYRSHGHTTIRKQTYIEVMDTELYDNKHISKSWTHNDTKTNIYRSHGHTTIR